MKKLSIKRVVSAIAAFAFMLVLGCGVCTLGGKAQAGIVSQKVTDEFDGSQLNSDLWTVSEGAEETVKLKSSGGSRAEWLKGGAADTAPLFTKEKYTAPFTLQFDFQSSLESWFGFNILMPGFADFGAVPMYDNCLIGLQKTGFADIGGQFTADEVVSQNNADDLPFAHGTTILAARVFGTDDIANVPLRIKLDFRAVADDIEMDVYMDSLVTFEEGQWTDKKNEPQMDRLLATYKHIIGIEKNTTAGSGNPVTGTGHIGFAPANGDVSYAYLSQFSLTKESEILLEDMFAESVIDGAKWSKRAEPQNNYIKSGTTKFLNLTSATGGKLLFNKDIRVKKSEKVFEGGFKLKADLNGTAETGILLGLADISEGIDTADTPYIYFKKDKLGLKIGGQAVDAVQEIDIAQFASEAVKVVLQVSHNGDVAVLLNDTQAAVFTGLNIEGKFAFTNLADAADNSADVQIDDFYFVDYVLEIPISKSLQHNFNVDYFNTDDWYISSQEPAGCMSVKNNMLTFEDSSDEAYFGTKHTYDDFILRYDLTDVQVKATGGPNGVPNSKWWIGVTFGKRSYDLGIAYSKMVYFRISTDPGQEGGGLMTFEALNFPASAVKVATRTSPDWFGTKFDKEDPVNFKFVAEDNTFAVYMKKQSQISFGEPYAKWINVETTGAVALTNTGWATYAIDNFALINTSDNFEQPNEIPPPKPADPTPGEPGDNPNVPPTSEELYFAPASKTAAVVSGVVSGAAALIVGAGGVLLILFLQKKKKKA